MANKQGSSHKTSNGSRSQRKHKNYKNNLAKRSKMLAARIKITRSDAIIAEQNVGRHVDGVPVSWDHVNKLKFRLADLETRYNKAERLAGRR